MCFACVDTVDMTTSRDEADGKSEPLNRDDEIKKDQLVPLGTLGKGSFGHVQLVKDKKTTKTYALKVVFRCCSRCFIARGNLVANQC